MWNCRLAETTPSLTKMLVLAHQIHRDFESSPITDYAEIARQLGVYRARVSQIVRPQQLALEIQEVSVDNKRAEAVRDIQAR
jgi:hypothetical protein